jgi:hypothetical protein
VSLLQISLYIQGNDMSNVLVTGQSPPMHDRSAPQSAWNYPTADQRWIHLVAVESRRYWPNVPRSRASRAEGTRASPTRLRAARDSRALVGRLTVFGRGPWPSGRSAARHP